MSTSYSQLDSSTVAMHQTFAYDLAPPAQPVSYDHDAVLHLSAGKYASYSTFHDRQQAKSDLSYSAVVENDLLSF